MKKFTDKVVKGSSTAFIEMNHSGKKIVRANAVARVLIEKGGPLFQDSDIAEAQHFAAVRALKKTGDSFLVKTVKWEDGVYRANYRLEGRRVIIEVFDIADLYKDARHDERTGLLKGGSFREILADAIARARRGQHEGKDEKLAVIFMDLDGFKRVNDSAGHEVGNLLLIEVAKRIQEVARRSGDVVAREGGDEFIFLAQSVRDKKDAFLIATRIKTAIAKPFCIGRKKFRVGISIGIVLGPNKKDDNPDSLIRHADIAMYHAKRFGGPCFYGDEA